LLSIATNQERFVGKTLGLTKIFLALLHIETRRCVSQWLPKILCRSLFKKRRLFNKFAGVFSPYQCEWYDFAWALPQFEESSEVDQIREIQVHTICLIHYLKKGW